jgi:Spy/CpxP family protein refolding chaperone
MFPSIHPSLVYRWKQARLAAACGVPLGCGPGGGAEAPGPDYLASEFVPGFAVGAFGVRRPLRLLAHKLGLSEAQVAEMARILNDLKTERAQAAVDDRRRLTAFADALAGDAFDEALATQGAEVRRKSGERLEEAVVRALGRIHKVLDAGQRERLAYLIRTGTLAL